MSKKKKLLRLLGVAFLYLATAFSTLLMFVGLLWVGPTRYDGQPTRISAYFVIFCPVVFSGLMLFIATIRVSSRAVTAISTIAAITALGIVAMSGSPENGFLVALFLATAAGVARACIKLRSS